MDSKRKVSPPHRKGESLSSSSKRRESLLLIL